jgi:hypothetical protein
MFWRKRTSLTACLALAASLSPAATCRAGFFDGHRLTVIFAGATTISSSTSPLVVTAGPGVELANFPFMPLANGVPTPRINIDFSGDNLIITALEDMPDIEGYGLSINSYVEDQIPHITLPYMTSFRINPETDWNGFVPEAPIVSVGSNLLAVNIGLASQNIRGLAGQQISLHILPEPAAATLAAVAALALRRRRK